jgi:type VI protein secretion system component Hcp
VSLTAAVDGSLYHQNVSTFTNVVPILGFSFSANASRDIATGASTGKNIYTPVTLYKEMDISSPLLMRILTTNEVFQATVFAVESASGMLCNRDFVLFLTTFCLADGHLQTTFAWKLTNGALDSVSYTAGASTLVETIAMIFQKMEIDATAGGTTIVTSFNAHAPIV